MASDVRVIVIAYRSAETLASCVQSVLGSEQLNISVTIVNNDPGDPGPAELAAVDGRIRLVEMGWNAGFCRAVNFALDGASESYVLLLNPDARVSSDYVVRLAELLDADHSIASAGGRILQGLDSRAAVIDSLGIEIAPGRRPRDVGHGDRDDGVRAGIVERFGVTAAAALYRRSTLDEVRVEGQVLPDDFFMYLDDVDLAWRLRLRGYRSVVDSAALAWHERAAARGLGQRDGALRKISRFVRRPNYVRELSWANLQLMLVRNDDPSMFLERLPDLIATRVPRDVVTILGNPKLAVRQRMRLAGRLRTAIRHRKLIQASRRVGPTALRPWLG